LERHATHSEESRESEGASETEENIFSVGRVSASLEGRNPTVRDELGGLIFSAEMSMSTVKIRHRPKQIHPNVTERRWNRYQQLLPPLVFTTEDS
jgi:hypothetical protein